MRFSGKTKNFNVLVTIDVEEYFHVFFGEVSNFPETWDLLEPDFQKMVPALYEIIRLTNGKCVLFVVGWLAEKYPEIILSLSQSGVEIGSHGYLHHPVDRMTPEEFSQDLIKSKRIIESAIGKPIRAFRAPGFSISPKEFETLLRVFDSGFTIDSSVVGGRLPKGKFDDTRKQILEPGFKFGSRYIPTGGGSCIQDITANCL